MAVIKEIESPPRTAPTIIPTLSLDEVWSGAGVSVVSVVMGSGWSGVVDVGVTWATEGITVSSSLQQGDGQLSCSVAGIGKSDSHHRINRVVEEQENRLLLGIQTNCDIVEFVLQGSVGSKDRRVVEVVWYLLDVVSVLASELPVNEDLVIGEGVEEATRWGVCDDAVYIQRDT